MNYYEILEVSVNASKEVIKNAYRALTKKYHPDSYKGNQEYAQEKMKEINQAYEVLMDDNKRLLYDYEKGFKIDPEAPKEEITQVKKEEKSTVKEDNLMTFIKEKKLVIFIAIIILFVIAFIIGSTIADSGVSDKEDSKNELNVNDDNSTKEDETNNSNTTYRPNNTVVEKPEKKPIETTRPVQNDSDIKEEDETNNIIEDTEDETIKEPDGIS